MAAAGGGPTCSVAGERTAGDSAGTAGATRGILTSWPQSSDAAAPPGALDLLCPRRSLAATGPSQNENIILSSSSELAVPSL